ncbi:GNAT family N-acetyltransferase [Brevibacillus fulvus]|nr:GNAT family N-acetyltransferase [Brevibacillus fulvus]
MTFYPQAGEASDVQTAAAIKLDFYRAEYEAALRAFQLPDNQLEFTALPAWVLEEALRDPHRYPIVILDGDEPVGFFILHEGEGIAPFTDNPQALLLRAFLIDFRKQGKGYAKAGMGLLPAFVAEHFPGKEEVVLAVNMRNLPAKRLYEKVGFRDRGETRMGAKGPQHLLYLPLA